jgi:hypothetical protein
MGTFAEAEDRAQQSGKEDTHREAVRREVRRQRSSLSLDLPRITRKIHWVVSDALRGSPASQGADRRIPWRRLGRQWEEMVSFRPLEPTGKPVVIQIREPSPLSPGQSLADWFSAERKAGKVRILNFPRLPSLIDWLSAVQKA